MNDKEMWNRMASHYQSTLHTGDESNYPNELMETLIHKGAAERGSYIMDIGCGVGKYAVRFGELGCNVHMLDFADEMLRYAHKNMQPFEVQYTAEECDWEQADVRGWEKSVDLAFAAMTPAVTGRRGVENMIAVSRRHCFISKFASFHNIMNERVCTALGLKIRDENFDGRIWMELADIIAEMGYLPEITYHNYSWENFLPLDQVVERFFDGYNMQLEDTAENRLNVRESLIPITNAEGIVHEQVQTKAAWIYWDVTIK